MPALLRLIAVALVPLFVANAVLWWPHSKPIAVVAIALLCLIPTALRLSIDE
jgi:hypothetical protein